MDELDLTELIICVCGHNEGVHSTHGCMVMGCGCKKLEDIETAPAHKRKNKKPTILDYIETGIGWFRLKMSKKMVDNQGKGTWHRQNYGVLLAGLEAEIQELKTAIYADKNDYTKDGIVYEAADVANFAMMIATKAHGEMGYDVSDQS